MGKLVSGQKLIIFWLYWLITQ